MNLQVTPRFTSVPSLVPYRGIPPASHEAKFDNTPGLVPLEKFPDLWWLDSELVYEGSVNITIPAGFITDDASIPKFLDWVPFLDRQGLSRLPGLLHDGIYSMGRSRGKMFADYMLEEACLAEGMSPFQANLIYQGVKLFGQSSWDDDALAGKFGSIQSGNFVTLTHYQAFLAAGATIYR